MGRSDSTPNTRSSGVRASDSRPAGSSLTTFLTCYEFNFFCFNRVPGVRAGGRFRPASTVSEAFYSRVSNCTISLFRVM